MIAENITLTDKMRDELIEYSEKMIDEHIYTEKLDFLLEDDRYYNWYHGYTKLSRPYSQGKTTRIFKLRSTATSGVVMTQYFGEQYQRYLLKKNERIYYSVHVYPPETVMNNTNVTLHLNMEPQSFQRYSTSSNALYNFAGMHFPHKYGRQMALTQLDCLYEQDNGPFSK